MSERQGVEIDYCPKCRGVWLDRGELDKIIERVVATEQPAAPAAPTLRPGEPPIPTAPPPPMGQPRPDYRDRDYDDDYYKRKKKRGLLGEIFDFD